jgi:hypothetical protein
MAYTDIELFIPRSFNATCLWFARLSPTEGRATPKKPGAHASENHFSYIGATNVLADWS